jgi:hypothetical protein
MSFLRNLYGLYHKYVGKVGRTAVAYILASSQSCDGVAAYGALVHVPLDFALVHKFGN